MSDTFLTREEVAELTGRKTKSKQVEQLRKMALPSWMNALNAPVVPRSAIEGRKEGPKPAERTEVVPRLLRPDSDTVAVLVHTKVTTSCLPI